MHRHNHNHSQGSLPRGRPVVAEEGAKASDWFEQFLTASTLKTILGSYRNICEYLHLKPNVLPLFYPKLKNHINSWKAKPLWKKFDTRANQKCYGRGKACPHTRVLIIGAGPCGLRTAIEAQLLGAKVVVVEKRDRMSRNNVLHLWPFVIDDLRALGAKKFFGKFCAGSIDHISIRQLQCILLKVALLLGVEVHTEVSFERLIEPNPNEKNGWRAEFKPADHPVSQFEFDVIIGADGKRNTLQGFKRKEFRGKLAIAITANFINKRTEAEARVEEISGVAFIFNQKFFKDLYAETGIDLENIVYYKDDTHYFVMTAKKQSLIDKGVIKEDLSDTAKLLAPDNVDREELMNYAREAAEFSTNYQMPDLEFAVNHYGQPDVAMFDFTSMYAAENASRVIEKHNYKLLSILVGDSLLEPFWPTGSGCARGFLSSMDAAWAIRSWGSDTVTPLEVIAERESIYRLLAQTTPENLNKDYKSYTLEPSTRYPNLNKNVLLPHQVTNLYDTDDPKSIELNPRPAPTIVEVPKKRRRRESHVDPDTLLSWIKEQVREHEDLEVTNITTSFRDGRVLCAIISHYRPDLLDYSAINAHDFAKNNQVAFDLLEKELGIAPIMAGEEMAGNVSPDFSTMLSYLTKVYDTFRCEIPHIKYPKWDKNLTITRTSAVILPSPAFPLRPVLITPHSSAKVSEESLEDVISSEKSYPNLYSVPDNSKSNSEDNLILIPIKSIEDYLSKDSIEMIKGSHDDKILVLKEGNNPANSTGGINRLKCKISKSDSLFSSVHKSRSTVSITSKKLEIGKRSSMKYINSKGSLEQKQRKISKIRNKDLAKFSNDGTTSPSFSGSSFDYSGDYMNQPWQKKIKTFTVNIKPLASTNCQKQVVNVKFSESKKIKKDESNETLEHKDSYNSYNSLNTECTENISSSGTQYSMAGSTQIALNFFHEMDIFLQKQALASQELKSMRHNLKVEIKPPRMNIPKDIPPILLGSDSSKEKDIVPDIIIKNVERQSDSTIAVQVVEFFSITNCLNIIPKLISNVSSSLNLNFFGSKDLDCLDKTKNARKGVCQRKFPPDASLAKVEGWIKTSNFESQSTINSEFNEPLKPITKSSVNDDSDSIITSVTKEEWLQKMAKANQALETKAKYSPTSNSRESVESMAKLVETLKSSKGVTKINNISSPWELYEGRSKSKSEPPDQFSTIIEAEESDMPEIKRNENILKVRTNVDKANIFATTAPPSRPSSRHKRHVDSSFLNKPTVALSQDRKGRKRKTFEKVGASLEDRQRRLEDIVSNRVDRHNKRRQQRKNQTEQFIKSMQMLQSNCKPDHSEPFEDYSIYLYRQTAPNFGDRVKNLEKQFIYVPDKDSRVVPTQTKRETDEDFAARIKDLEDKWREPISVEKKPKDLLRAIGKIETSDWNIKEIEKKIIENKLGKTMNKDKEKVPKWSREQFLARQTKMERQHLDRQNSAEVKFAEIDRNIKQLEQKLKEGSVRDFSQQKVASIAEKLVGKATEPPPTPEPSKPVQKPNARAMIPINQGSEFCHFCSKRVYLVERLTAEGRIFHTGCFRCQYCHTSLRLGTCMFDREGLYGHRFYCAQHFGMPGEISRPEKKLAEVQETPQKNIVSSVLGVDLLDRVQTPERIEFSNLSTGHISSDHDESPSPIDEDEWTDRNNINSVIDSDSSDDSSSASDTDSDDEAYEEALEEPITKEGTLRWAERYKKRYSHKDDDSNSDGYSSSDHFSYYENSSGDDDSDTATEGEEEIRARELRKQEVRVEPPIDAGTDTEVASCDTSSESSSEIQNSATEISTDSEFAHDDPTPTRETPRKIFDGFVTKTRGVGASHQQPKKVQVKSSMLQQPMNGRHITPQTKDIELKFTPLVSTPIIRKPTAAPSSLLFSRGNQQEGYALNRTQSTGGIATKVSLELKKKYLLGEAHPGGCIQKSGSASTLDSKFKSFHTNISDCQKLLKPATEISPSMQAFCNKLSQRTSPLSPTFGLINKEKSPPNLNLSLEAINSTESTGKMEITKCVSASSIPEIMEANVNEPEGRPRSPLHEKQIIVPVIDWFKLKQKRESDFMDSLSSDSDSDDIIVKKPPHVFTNIPRLEVHDDSGAILKDPDDIAFDSLNVSINYNNRSSLNDTPKSITSEKKTLNQPKTLPDMTSDSVLPEYHSALHTKQKPEDNTKIVNKDSDKSIKDSSRRSSSSINDEIGTTALTETELDDFEDVEYELISDIHVLNNSNEQIKNKPSKLISNRMDTNKSSDFGLNSEIETSKRNQKPSAITECINILSLNIDNIEFMDTGTEETSSEENLVMKNNGYVQFDNEDEFAEDSLSPALDIVETVNPLINSFNFNVQEKISSQTEINIRNDEKPENSACSTKVADTKLDRVKQVCDNEDDSILNVETGTTTEENTCSDSTVKNITERIITEDNIPEIKNLTPVEEKSPAYTNGSVNNHPHEDFPEFEEHCQRLQSKIEFSNVKDSLDIKRTRRKSKPDISKPDLIQEEKDKNNVAKQEEYTNITSPKLSKKEEIEKERSMNQKLVQEMVMNKMRAQNKSLERKKRTRNSFSPIRPFELSKSATTDLPPSNKDVKPLHSPTPDVLLSTIPSPLQKSQSSILTRKDKEVASPNDKILEQSRSDSPGYYLPDISKTSNNEIFQTPKNPLRIEKEEVRKTTEKLRQDARARCRLLSDEELGLSPEDRLIKLRQIATSKRNNEIEHVDVHIQDSIESLVINTDRRNSLFYSNDTLKRNTSFRRSKSGDATMSTTSNSGLVPKLSVKRTEKTSPPMRTKSVSEINRFSHMSTIDLNSDNNNVNIYKSDPNLLMPNKKHTKKPKDRERRKSITKMITELFSKKKESPSSLTPSKGFLSRISPKSKNKSKSWFDLDLGKIEKIEAAALKRNSISEINLTRDSDGNVSPPPIPPLPINYVRRHSLKDESSDADNEYRHDLGSCEALDQSEAHIASTANFSGKKLNRSARKTARQVQLKRHRTAQEIQRKLEETEVKTRELELRGVQVEKALRGESNGSFLDEHKEESELLKEWFDLMRDRTELRRYEKELMVRAQELELEDRHARLQHELRDRLENNEPKTKEEMEVEGDIIKEMMDIVAKRDSLINLLEEDRLRYLEEDRDFEEQILAKGIHLTPLVKSLCDK